MLSAALPATPEGKLPDNITYFVRALRRAGVPVGTAQLADCIRAVQAVGFTRRADFFVTLRACLITRPEHLTVFARVFALFWRDPEFLEKTLSNLLPVVGTPAVKDEVKPAQRRAAEALGDGRDRVPDEDPPKRDEISVDAAFSFSRTEVLKNMDFEAMTNAQIYEAQTLIKRLKMPLPKGVSRRYAPAGGGRRTDVRAVLQKARRTGGEITVLPKTKPRITPPGLVVLCDISGSMAVYSKMMMHFIHTLGQNGAGHAGNRAANKRPGVVHGFTLGTRLTNITRTLDIKDPDAALKAVSRRVKDWDGGTRLGACLRDFNENWSRRVLASNAVVLLITDGLERDDTQQLAAEAERLRRSAKYLIWLNPLLRYEAFEPRASGIRALLPHADVFKSCHSLKSLSALADVLGD